jgi:hypothetical protein
LELGLISEPEVALMKQSQKPRTVVPVMKRCAEPYSSRCALGTDSTSAASWSQFPAVDHESASTAAITFLARGMRDEAVPEEKEALRAARRASRAGASVGSIVGRLVLRFGGGNDISN